MTDYEAALERARKMKATIPDAQVKGLGRVRDLAEEQIANWICHGQNTQAGASPRPNAGGPGALPGETVVDGAGVEPLTARPGAVDLRIRGLR